MKSFVLKDKGDLEE